MDPGTPGLRNHHQTLDPAGDVLKPEHLYRAMLQEIGVTDDVADLRVEGLSALFG